MPKRQGRSVYNFETPRVVDCDTVDRRLFWAASLRAENGIGGSAMGDEDLFSASQREQSCVAILPFTCVGDVSHVIHLADGINANLRVSLGRFEDLPMIGMQSVNRYRDTTATFDQISRDLGARFIVSGSLRRVGDTLRVATDLIDASDSSQLWSRTLQSSYTVHGLLEIENEITRQVLDGVARRLGTTLVAIRREPRGKPPRELSAYEASSIYHHYNAVHGQEAHHRACRALEKAIGDDPEYALARAELGELYCDVHALGYDGPDDALERARDCAVRAVELDNLCQHARFTMAYVRFLEGNHAEVLRQAKMAIALNPNVAHLVGYAAFLIAFAGDYETGCNVIDEMEVLNPHQPGWMRMPSIVRALDRAEFDVALEEAHRIRFAQLAWDPLLRSAAAALAIRQSEAKAAYQELTEIYPEVTDNPEPYIRAYVHDDSQVGIILEGLEAAKKTLQNI
jgi:adenylate cyclase